MARVWGIQVEYTTADMSVLPSREKREEREREREREERVRER